MPFIEGILGFDAAPLTWLQFIHKMLRTTKIYSYIPTFCELSDNDFFNITQKSAETRLGFANWLSKSAHYISLHLVH